MCANLVEGDWVTPQPLKIIIDSLETLLIFASYENFFTVLTFSLWTVVTVWNPRRIYTINFLISANHSRPEWLDLFWKLQATRCTSSGHIYCYCVEQSSWLILPHCNFTPIYTLQRIHLLIRFSCSIAAQSDYE